MKGTIGKGNKHKNMYTIGISNNNSWPLNGSIIDGFFQEAVTIIFKHCTKFIRGVIQIGYVVTITMYTNISSVCVNTLIHEFMTHLENDTYEYHDQH